MILRYSVLACRHTIDCYSAPSRLYILCSTKTPNAQRLAIKLTSCLIESVAEGRTAWTTAPLCLSLVLPRAQEAGGQRLSRGARRDSMPSFQDMSLIVLNLAISPELRRSWSPLPFPTTRSYQTQIAPAKLWRHWEFLDSHSCHRAQSHTRSVLIVAAQGQAPDRASRPAEETVGLNGLYQDTLPPGPRTPHHHERCDSIIVYSAEGNSQKGYGSSTRYVPVRSAGQQHPP